MEWEKAYKVGKYEYRTFANSLWIKVFFHDMSTLDGFANDSEPMLCDNANKYSIFSELNSKIRKKNGKFEFILEYPELSRINWWQQERNPIDEVEEGQKFVTGYKAIYIGAPCNGWGGLAKSVDADSSYTFINGVPSIQGIWMFALGMYKGVTWGSNNKLPSNNDQTNIVYLWAKVSDKLYKTCAKNNFHSNLHFYIVFIIFS